MLISHESPISILEDSRKYNHYDYALVHLFETQPEYYNFFKQSLAMGREVLLDNSIFELKEAFDSEKFAKYVEDLKPTYYVVPDVLEDAKETMASFHRFTLRYPTLPGLKIGVVQGQTYEQLVKCYKFMSERADYIAISFDYSWYQTIGLDRVTINRGTIPYTDDEMVDIKKLSDADLHRSTLERFSNGRLKLISMLMADGIWNDNKPHHLLGNALPQEMKHYRGIDSIRSVDTSNPVVAGIKGIRYIKNYGMTQKPKTLLADLIDCQIDSDQWSDIMFNVQEYRKFCNGQ